MSPSSPSVVVVVAHGSRVDAANDAHRAFCADLAARMPTGIDVVPAFLELADPSIPDALDAAAEHHSRVVVHPHFLAPGNHTTRDIPALVDEAGDRHPATHFELADHTGADPHLVDAVAATLARHAGPGATG